MNLSFRVLKIATILMMLGIVTGCAGRHFYFTPVAVILVSNDCRDTIVHIDTSRGNSVVLIPFGNTGRVVLTPGSLSGFQNAALVARFIRRGKPIGSYSTQYGVGQYSEWTLPLSCPPTI